MSTPVPTRVSADEFLEMPEAEGFELVDGELVEVPMGFISSLIGGELFGRLREHVRSAGLGIVAPQETGIQVWPDEPSLVRKPDALFIARGRMTGGLPQGWLTVVPDLVVEVVSPNDRAEYLERKLNDYRRAGVPLIWVLFPDTRTAHVISHDGPAIQLGPDGVLDGEDVVPGFRCSLADLYDAAAAVE
jgi:Uma2 family endonuclease